MLKAIYKNDYNEYQKFADFHSFRARMKHIMIFSGVFFILSVVLFILAFSGYTRFAPSAIVSFLFIFILPVLNWLILKAKVRKNVKNNSNFSKIKNTYIFNETDFILHIESGKKSEDHTFEYSKLFKVYETKTNYYLYLNKLNAFIVTKSGICEGTSNELSNIFKNNISEKFKSSNRGK